MKPEFKIYNLHDARLKFGTPPDQSLALYRSKFHSIEDVNDVTTVRIKTLDKVIPKFSRTPAEDLKVIMVKNDNGTFYLHGPQFKAYEWYVKNNLTPNTIKVENAYGTYHILENPFKYSVGDYVYYISNNDGDPRYPENNKYVLERIELERWTAAILLPGNKIAISVEMNEILTEMQVREIKLKKML